MLSLINCNGMHVVVLHISYLYLFRRVGATAIRTQLSHPRSLQLHTHDDDQLATNWKFCALFHASCTRMAGTRCSNRSVADALLLLLLIEPAMKLLLFVSLPARSKFFIEFCWSFTRSGYKITYAITKSTRKRICFTELKLLSVFEWFAFWSGQSAVESITWLIQLRSSVHFALDVERMMEGCILHHLQELMIRIVEDARAHACWWRKVHTQYKVCLVSAQRTSNNELCVSSSQRNLWAPRRRCCCFIILPMAVIIILIYPHVLCVGERRAASSSSSHEAWAESGKQQPELHMATNSRCNYCILCVFSVRDLLALLYIHTQRMPRSWINALWRMAYRMRHDTNVYMVILPTRDPK